MAFEMEKNMHIDQDDPSDTPERKRVEALKEEGISEANDSEAIYNLAQEEGHYRENELNALKELIPEEKHEEAQEGVNKAANAFSDKVLEGLEKDIDIARTKDKLREAEKDSMHDDLTGLLNRKTFETSGIRIIDESIRFNRPCSVLMLDIDYFKRVNDTFGHLAGDKVLQGVASIIEKTIRASDVPGRFGGEEFAVILPETNPTDAENLAERIKLRVEEANIDQIKVTISIGVSGIEEIIVKDPKKKKREKKKKGKISPHDMEKRKIAIWPEGDGKNNLDMLIGKADQALYASKKSGRNKVTVFEEKGDEKNNVPSESEASETDEFFKKHFD